MKNILFYFVVIINIIVVINIYFINEKKIEYINVEIKGAINKPGVYKLEDNSIVDDLIKKAGGLKENADISVTSLVKHLNDSMVVIIYTKDEINEMRKGNTVVKYVDKECFCPKIENNSCIDKTITNNEEIVISNKVSINSATKEELMTLKGIGESKANSIINYRETNKGFKTLEELLKVKGIGNSIYEKIKDNITL